MEAKPPVRFRKLRIVWSVAWGVLCVLLVVLWARSYSYWDNLHGPLPGGHHTVLNSLQSQLSFGLGEFSGADAWGWSSVDASEHTTKNLLPQTLSIKPTFGFGASRTTATPNRIIALIPHWFAALICTALAVAPWFTWRFSLRDLLIAITLLATVLGIIAVTR